MARASRSSVSAGTFSNSVVTAAHAAPSCVERPHVGVRGAQMDVRDQAGRAGRVGIEHHDAVAQGPRAQREHPAELAAAQHADGGARQDHAEPGSLRASTRSVWAVRSASSFPATAASVSARMAAAKSAAFCAPAAPMAKVATGTPAGI